MGHVRMLCKKRQSYEYLHHNCSYMYIPKIKRMSWICLVPPILANIGKSKWPMAAIL